MSRPSFTLVPVDEQAFEDARLLANVDDDSLRLRDLLTAHPAFSLQPLIPEELDLPVSSVLIEYAVASPDTPLYAPPGIPLAGAASAPPPRIEEIAASPRTADPVDPPAVVSAGSAHPEQLSEREAVLLAHNREIDDAAAYLERGLSVLITCEKLLVEHLADEIAGRSRRPSRTVRMATGPETSAPAIAGVGGSRRSELVSALHTAVEEAADGEIVVVPHLDLLAGGNDAALTAEARELTDVLYDRSSRILLAFVDPSLALPDVLAKRFAARRAIDILPRVIVTATGEPIPMGRALVTREEAELFAGFDAVDLYKHVAGMNAARLRQALQFAYLKYCTDPTPPTFTDLREELRTFKANTSIDSFEIPNTTFDDIGGYDNVKVELGKAIRIIAGADAIPEHLRPHLVPKGFIFYGPPGTGKTLFAKAIATQLGGTILVVSGPEITDKYVGESERKVRDIFSQARRNAPSVVVFDEFDSIAGQRSGRDDGGTRAGNAVVAQLLTELDGFRAEVPVLIIGTTNRVDIIDEALLRPSRFRPVSIDLPDATTRRAIAEKHAQHFECEVSDDLLDRIAEATAGMNGDDIRSLFRDARADELVGSKRKPDAQAFGRLVGELLQAKQQRDVERQRAAPGRPAAVARRDVWVTIGRAGTSSRAPNRPAPVAIETIVEDEPNASEES